MPVVMNYLYGDSTPSRLTTNFLEFLRDAMDCLVFVLQRDEQIKAGHAEMRALRAEADAETARLETFVSTVRAAIETAPKGAADSPTAAYAVRLSGLALDAQRAAIAAIEAQLAADVQRIELAEEAGRVACTKALALLLVPNDPPEGETTTRVVLGAGGKYEPTRAVRSAFGLEWELELAIPGGNLWAAPVRVDRVVPHLEIRAPQLAGWISKEVKVKAQKLERHVVTELTSDGETARIELRTEPGIEIGYGLELAIATKKVQKLTRVGPADDASNGPFEVHADDAAPLADLVEKLLVEAATFERKKLLSATVDGTDFEKLPAFIDIVERLIAMMAPIVREIAERSLTPNELIIRRLLGDDRREEVFVAKATLREKYDVLPPPLRALFAPLDLDVAIDRAPREVPPASGKTARAELPRSLPPPPPEPPAPSKPPPVPRTTARPSGAAVPPPAELLAVPSRSSEPSVEVIVTVEPENEVLVAALRKISTLSRNGRIDDAYAEYGRLFTSDAFADLSPDEQRHALRVMLQGDRPSPATPSVVEAHRAARARLDVLTTALETPGDYELLGLAHVALEDPKGASAAFSAALAIERERDPASARCAELERRMATL